MTNRMVRLGWTLSAVQYAGFTCMPFVGGFLAFVIKDQSFPILGDALVLTSFTAPVRFDLLFSVRVCIYVCVFRFVPCVGFFVLFLFCVYLFLYKISRTRYFRSSVT